MVSVMTSMTNLCQVWNTPKEPYGVHTFKSFVLIYHLAGKKSRKGKILFYPMEKYTFIMFHFWNDKIEKNVFFSNQNQINGESIWKQIWSFPFQHFLLKITYHINTNYLWYNMCGLWFGNNLVKSTSLFGWWC